MLFQAFLALQPWRGLDPERGRDFLSRLQARAANIYQPFFLTEPRLSIAEEARRLSISGKNPHPPF
jgi:hypothetical protein